MKELDILGNVTEILCTVEGAEEVVCNGTIYHVPEQILTYTDWMFWMFIGIYVALVLFAGMVSGLTLGMLSLDKMTLKVLEEAGTPKEKKYARRIMPVVEKHHLLLVTLLLSNALAVESMPLCLDRVSDPITAIVVSVTAVLLFGEVFPQALCSRYGLAIGATLAPVVYVLMALFFIISWPLSKLLDCLLGGEHRTFFRRAELKALVGLHGPEDEEDEHGQGGPLSIDEVLIIKGALEMRDKSTGDAMVPLESVFMLNVNAKMDRATMKEVLQSAHSRVPVYENARHNILGVLLVKTLILLDPDDAVPVSKLLKNPFYCRQVSYVAESKPLYDLLNEFQTGKSHLSFVISVPDELLTISQDIDNLDTTSATKQSEIVGIITLEDVIEELLQEEIIDETDVYVDVHKRVRVARARAKLYQRSSSAINSVMQTPAATPVPDRKETTRKKKRPRKSHPDGDTDYTSDTPLLQD